MPNEIEKSKENPVRHSEGYNELLEEIRAIRTETFKESVEADFKGRGMIGQLIRSEQKAYGLREQIAKDLGVVYRTIEYCVGFYDTYPEKTGDKAYMKLPDVKNWSGLLEHHSKGKKEECKHELERIPRWRCRKCGRVFSTDISQDTPQ